MIDNQLPFFIGCRFGCRILVGFVLTVIIINIFLIPNLIYFQNVCIFEQIKYKMKNIIIFVFILLVCQSTVVAQQKFDSYFSSYFKNKEFDIKLTFESELKYTLYIDMQSKEGINNGGMILTHYSHQEFIDSLTKAKNKFVEWANVAKTNKVIEVTKQIELDFSPPACYFRIANNNYTHRNSNFVFIFNVEDRNPSLSIWTQNLKSTENRYVTHEGFLLIFKSEKEITDFLNKISVQKVKDFIKKPKTSDLFKN